MGFWSGFEGLTGHQPGAFKGFSFKDILDDDLWKRRERLGGRQSRQFEETGVVPETAWYKGMGRPELMGPRVGAAGVPVKESQIPSVRHNAPTYQERFDATTLANQQRRNALWGSGPATVSAARPWANIQSQMLSNPRQEAIDFENTTRQQVLVDAARPTADKTTVKKVFADPNKSDEIIETIKEKVPIGPAYNRPPPNWLERVAHAEGPINPGYFGRPTTFSSPMQPEGALTSSAEPTSIMNMFNMKALQDLARRKWEERMRARGGY